MPDPREQLAMMTPHGIQIGKPFGGVPALTALDIAGAVGMAHLEPCQWWLLEPKYLDDWSHIHELRAWWLMQIGNQRRAENWTCKPGQMTALRDLSLEETLDPNRCRRCRGTGERLVDSKPRPCLACKGTGMRYRREEILAHGLRVSRREYRNRWLPRMAWCRFELMRIELSALTEIARRLRRQK